MSVLQQKIEAAQAQGRKALIPYLPCGFPDLDKFWEAIAELDASGADIIEIGVPFTDPVADGPVIEQAAQECLERGVTLKYLMQGLKERKGQFKAGIVLMGYVNPFLQYGLDRLAQDCVDAGVHGFIIPDLPHEEADMFEKAIRNHPLDLIPLVGLNTTPERMKLYADGASGFAYFVSVLGITGGQSDLPPEILDKLRQAKETFDVPMALGFGISSKEQVTPFGDLLDAVVFGSALIRHIQEGGAPKEFMARFK
jgi:tryptophan synthase alpha chain